MLRHDRLALGVALLLAVPSAPSHAQYYGGYGGYGWGGWGGGGATVQGDIARGLGYYAMGAGVYNRETAVANSINADTVMRYNEYLWESQQVINKREYLRMARRQQRAIDSGDQIYQRMRDNPTASDVSHGDALNVILDQVTDPRIHSSALRMANDPVSADAVANIPFQNASEAVTLSLNQLAAKDAWPTLLRSEAFADDRRNYQDLIQKALDEDESEGGQISPETLAKVRGAIYRIRTRLESLKGTATPSDYNQALNYVKGLGGLSKMLENPDVEKALAELKKISKTSLGSLLGFMHTYNLRFGPAGTPEQRAVYDQLYPVMDAYRDRVLKDSGVDTRNTAQARGKGAPTDFFQGMHLDHLVTPNANP